MTLKILNLSQPDNGDASTPSPKPSTPFQCLSKYLYFPNKDQQDWWDSSGLMLSKMLINAKYDVHQQYQYLTLFAQNVVPFLGPLPTAQNPGRYKSLMGGGRTVELSYNFQKSKSTARVSFEAVNHVSGTSRDPFNQQATNELLQSLQRLYLDIDLYLYHRLVNDLGLSAKQRQSLTQSPDLEKFLPIRSQSVIGLDLVGGDVKVKFYMLVAPKALATGIPPSGLLFQCLSKVMGNDSLQQSLSILESYMQDKTVKSPPPTGPPGPPDVELTGVSCDLVEPSKTRFKLYSYSLEVSLASACDMWTLGGRLQHPEILKGLEIVRKLWSIFNIPEERRQIPDGSWKDPIPLMFNFEIYPGAQYPQPKMYLPIFGMSDREKAQALVTFFQENGWDEQARDYMDNMIAYYPSSDLDQTSDLQLWLSFSYTEATGIYMTMYYCHPFDISFF
ncbi:cyclo-L-Trp-L-Trp prenyltransferase [Aspergillus steynii IBT 23096]|uniref:Cyclo-L-Trp-L-Trp prenyltransferase n=1 Tax=Aspergillus steynii IBT 23096 TaxID=1392250 RepID=A0A2I2GLG7_9EURO|nr:cyclo-L-Trp-L-Trp prenyltransferase [Aspergillus steynii IBT 23096]PLB53720.1 cyclo-L-Trp-L-Trp prenyltransferase [Aspergillus steynii IBT 23096]